LSRKLLSILAVVGLLLGMFGATAAAPIGVAAVAPDHITIQWGGCRGDATTAQYIPNPAFDPNVTGSTPFICTLPTYTNGNLGKGWNELDLVPQRLTLQSASNSNTDYDLRVTADALKSGVFGYDFITVPTINPTLSGAGCAITAVGAQQGTLTDTIYRNITIHQPLNTICVVDVDFRLAVGSHLYPGSALHTHVTNENGGSQGVGNHDNSIPVNEILPQSISKDMAATRDANTLWTVEKHATPAVINLGDTCDTSNPRTASVTVVVSWDNVGVTPNGDAIINVKIYASNPAHRIITVNATDVTREGATVGSGTVVDTRGTGDVNVPALTNNFKILDVTFTVASTATDFNDVVTATYKDLLTGIPVPGSTTASDTATVQTGNVTNASASVTDVEQMTGAGLSFSVPTPPASGSFTNYNGGSTVGPVNWASGTVTADGSITFNKTVSVTAATSTSGTLSDIATLTPGDSQVGQNANASTTISSSRTSTLTINKSIPNILQGNETQSFSFNVVDAANNVVANRVIGFGAGQTSGSATVPGLQFGATYSVVENVPSGWTVIGTGTESTGALGCTGSVSFADRPIPASADVAKVTFPAGREAGFQMTITGPGLPAAGVTATTAGPNAIGFAFDPSFAFLEGTYTIVESPRAGWAQESSTGCTFTVNYPADDGRVFHCVFANAQPSIAIGLTPLTDVDPIGDHHVVTATVTQDDQLPIGAPNGDASNGPGPAPDGTLVTFSLIGTNPAGSIDFFPTSADNTCTTLAGQCSVQITTNVPGSTTIHATTSFSVLGVPLTAATNSAGNSTDAQKQFVAGTLIIRKQTLPDGSTQSFGYTTTGAGLSPFSLVDGGVQTFTPLVPGGTRTVTETLPVAGWNLTSVICTASGVGTSVSTSGATVSAVIAGNGVVDCTYTNTQNGRIEVEKQTVPDGSAATFGFTGNITATLSDGQFAGVDVAPGNYTVTEAVKSGWDLTSIACSDSNSTGTNRTANYVVAPGETVRCVFTNRERGHVVVNKTFKGGAIPAGTSFIFTLRTGASAGNDGTVLETQTATSANGGVLNFAELLVPGNHYQICEQIPAAGWNLSIASLPGAFGGDPLSAQPIICVDFTVTAGQTQTFNLDNTPPPGGVALTIGYWKNHATCGTSGVKKDRDALDKALATFPIALGQTKPGFLVGDLYVDTCQEAVSLLSKQATDSTKQQSSDPAFNFAAQYVAYKLNIAAGSDPNNAAANAAAADGQAILDAISFDGSLAGGAHTAISATQAAALNADAHILDLYNNNNL
jgi:hypothetical protein